MNSEILGGPTKARSVSKDSHPPQDSKENLTSLLAPSRPSRKTKEAAKSYLNLLGQKLAGKKRDAETEVPLRLTASPEPSPPRSANQVSATKKSAESTGKEIEEVKEEIKVEELEDDSNSAESVATKVDDTSSNGSKSPRGPKFKEEKDQLRKERKDKKKSKTSLKDLQNILLEEAKRKISDTPSSTKTSNSSVGKTPSSTPVESECTTPDLDTDRIVISQKTGYINVKPRHSSVEDNLNKSSPPLTVQQRRNSLSNSTHSRLSGGKIERTVTPPRKILPKCEESETRNSVESPNR